jgi:hypothetical protein
MIGYETSQETEIFVNLNQTVDTDFTIVPEAVEVAGIVVSLEADPVLNSSRTGAATFIAPEQVVEMPSLRRSVRDLSRLDPRSDGNFSFGGRNWLYNNISLDGSYFGNPFGLDDPAPGGQTNAEPVPYDAIEAVQVSVAPYDVRQSGFTGAAVNSVTKSGTNQWRGSAYTFLRNESFIGDQIGDVDVLVPELSFNQSGVSIARAAGGSGLELQRSATGRNAGGYDLACLGRRPRGDPPADDRRLRLRPGRVRELHPQYRQRQVHRQVRLERERQEQADVPL